MWYIALFKLQSQNPGLLLFCIWRVNTCKLHRGDVQPRHIWHLIQISHLNLYELELCTYSDVLVSRASDHRNPDRQPGCLRTQRNSFQSEKNYVLTDTDGYGGASEILLDFRKLEISIAIQRLTGIAALEGQLREITTMPYQHSYEWRVKEHTTSWFHNYTNFIYLFSKIKIIILTGHFLIYQYISPL